MDSVCPERSVTCVTWNHDGSNLAVGLRCGFIIYSTELLHLVDGKLFEILFQPVDGGAGLIALHGQCNLVFISGWAYDHRATVAIYDLSVKGEEHDSRDRAVLAKVTMAEAVNGLCFHPLLVMVGTESGLVHVFNQKLEKIQEYKTSQKIRTFAGATSKMALGTMLDKEVAGGVNYLLLRGVVAGPTPGSVRCIRYVSERSMEVESSQSSLEEEGGCAAGPLEENVVELHTAEVQCIAITVDGRCAVTVSARGTMLKLLDVRKGVVIGQYSRGAAPNTVLSLALHQWIDRTVLTCISDSGTLHIFHGPPLKRSSEHHETADTTTDAKWSVPVVQRFNDYISSVGAKFRITIPEDGLSDVHCRERLDVGMAYSTVVRIHDASLSPTILVAQRYIKRDGTSSKGRLLFIKVDMAAEVPGVARTKDLRSFYFPKSEM
ncbi:hypothetical protein, conserved [Trypanosoma brucei brucei TREU927]|uniref:Uncharacterized protein n=1 Tax=Trypanosoma brucei brucei (strain 927/4 GUTat10.1) TaxID=185431 RepID=Q389C0_TRYB2|nr:hypothetical protein, conserved [Trypanosoma brucei brucei TREU927]EAN78600.1 hypothetical protein, conserved [Trypanosoma brucei brucei TREU927]